MFSSPTKRIFDSSDLALFNRSLAYKRLHQTISFLVRKVTSTEVPNGWLSASLVTRADGLDSPKLDISCPDTSAFSKPVQHVLSTLHALNVLLDETPPLKGPRRFGNMACRDWHAKVDAKVGGLLKGLADDEGFILELQYYLSNAFGSSLRLDYGSGHELSFVAFVGGLLQKGLITQETPSSEVLAVFAKYYDLVRRLILEYNLEPAGSHGVWGLDDHFHFIYILGAAQFNTVGDKQTHYVPPVLQILSPTTISAYKTSNLYVNAIAFIFMIKRGPFNEHSPIIYDIHKTVSLWAKVLSGLLKMYEVEVLGKFPVVQHFWFGQALYPWKDASTLQDIPTRRAETKPDDNNASNKELPGLINGFVGTKTTKNNITMTGAPWSRMNASNVAHDRNSPGMRNFRNN